MCHEAYAPFLGWILTHRVPHSARKYHETVGFVFSIAASINLAGRKVCGFRQPVTQVLTIGGRGRQSLPTVDGMLGNLNWLS